MRDRDRNNSIQLVSRWLYDYLCWSFTISIEIVSIEIRSCRVTTKNAVELYDVYKEYLHYWYSIYIHISTLYRYIHP